ncbi:putative zinc finger CCHC domain-containing protein At4g19190 [Silene latifolia]|uniref:putative zinc finger CCHC domain-containing protein At4g19190 n=1 Tax=Silene latifolia TaxID=37657 RepID=UPI003D7715AE
MEDEEGGGGGGVSNLRKRLTEKGGEVDYKTTSGTAWSHNFLNQKPWHPLSYPNQRRKWIAEQTHAQRERRTDEVAREYAQEQDFLRQTSLLSQKEKQKVDLMQAVSFMYVRPPGYNAESAKAAEILDSTATTAATAAAADIEGPVREDKKKARPKDVFGRSLPTEEQFAVLKNAPRLETGVAGRAKPFAVEIRNVKCARCGNFGHQSGDRDCPLKDVIMPNEESRLKRDDPLTTIMAHIDSTEPLKWELKQKPGISPPRGGFQPDDPNQQIVAEDIFDEYGGFLSGGSIPELLTNFSSKKHKKKKSGRKSKHKKRRSSTSSCEDTSSGGDTDSDYDRKNSKKSKSKTKLPTDSDEDSDSDKYKKSRKEHRQKREKSKKSLSDGSGDERYYSKNRHNCSHKADNMDSSKYRATHNDRLSDFERKLSSKGKRSSNYKTTKNDAGFSSSDNSETERRRRKHRYSESILSEKLESDRYRRGRRH